MASYSNSTSAPNKMNSSNNKSEPLEMMDTDDRVISPIENTQHLSSTLIIT
ncbi:hypothetical protein I4U23_021950 [Adineta vaga]|nr:hypothetical protein I4U23_021950 [Adineta vaga]